MKISMTQTQTDYRMGMGRIESLLAQAEQLADGDVASAVEPLVQDLLDYHRAAIARMIELSRQPGEQGLLRRWANDEFVASVLLLYDLHPDDLSTRVERALEQVRPYLKSHGGDVELLGIEEGVVRVQMNGSCHGCPSSGLTLKTKIEDAICAAAPDAVAIEAEQLAEGVPTANGLVPLTALTGVNGNGSH
jgi:Fe-S cluster biogenesis protein NfuA